MTDVPLLWWGVFVISIVLVSVLTEPTEKTAGSRLGGIVERLGRTKLLWLLATGVSGVLSIYLFFTGDHERGIFVGLWVPSILSAANLLSARPN